MSALLVLALLAAGHSSNREPEKITFQYNFKTGQIIHTQLNISTQMQMGTSDTELDTTTHVDEAKDDGSATLTTSIDSGTTSIAGRKMHLPGMGRKFQMTVSKFGKRLEAVKDPRAVVTVQEFPDHPIAVGESWDGFVHMNSGRSTIDVTAHFTLESVKTVDGHKIAHVLMAEDNTNEKSDIKIQAKGWMDWNVDESFPLVAHSEGEELMGKMTVNFVMDQTSTIEAS